MAFYENLGHRRSFLNLVCADGSGLDQSAWYRSHRVEVNGGAIAIGTRSACPGANHPHHALSRAAGSAASARPRCAAAGEGML
ncbi:hypothetical protein GFS60_07741 (plasmid) [Rhodococcus sp. WAY2]|nr:hypothetical protein GFS60_07741 [Rhodococcus sp. WAY2]